MKEFINFEKNILPTVVKLIVPAYILQTLWLLPWDYIGDMPFKAIAYGVIYWLVSLVILRAACEWFLISFNAFGKFLTKD
tara:strand:+ start:1344 stop:1583 length:240 start_codon:yes stop_codon:yes gene_type:complete